MANQKNQQSTLKSLELKKKKINEEIKQLSDRCVELRTNHTALQEEKDITTNACIP